MSFTDFEFNGQRASDFGCMVCIFDGNPGLEIVDIGSNLSLNTVNKSMTNKFDIMSTKYEEPYTTTFQIGKHGCDRYNQGDMYMEEQLVARLIRWLNKKKYQKFKMLYSDGKYSDVWYKGTFPNIKMVTLNEQVVGLEVTFQANAPFGYYDDLEYEMDFTDVNERYSIFDTSDEIGFIYPHTLEINILQDGDLVIKNSQENKTVVIKNCIAGETITLNADIKHIESNMAHPKLYNDFNYNFVKVINKSGDIDDYYGAANEENEAENIYTVTLPCIIRLVYAPICKMGVI